MKTPRPQSTGGRARGLGTVTTLASLLLAALPLAAAGPASTGTGYLVGVPVPGILCTNASGQVSLKGNVHVLMVQADDARLTGRCQAAMDLAYQADGTALFGGAACQEVGTWDLVDPANPKFTPTGGAWDMIYRGVAQADGSDVITLTGYGVGGGIDGLRLEETITKGPGVPFDPAIPYLGTAVIKPTPVNTREVIDNFDDNKLTGWNTWSSNGQGRLIETNGQFTVRGHWPGVHTVSPYDSWAKGWMTTKTWAIADGQTLEWRVDLIRMSESTSIVKPDVSSGARNLGYSIAVGHDFVAIAKWMPGFAVLSCEQATIRKTNVVLSLTMTRAQTNLVLTARVLEPGEQGAVLFERSVVDTPEAEPTLATAEFETLTGMRLPWNKDVKGMPLFSGDYLDLEIFQYNDGTKPEATAVFDNLELRRYEVPQVGIERAMRLTWPAPAGVNYAVEAAPTVLGPWLLINDTALPGLKQMTVPANRDMQFFRLR